MKTTEIWILQIQKNLQIPWNLIWETSNWVFVCWPTSLEFHSSGFLSTLFRVLSNRSTVFKVFFVLHKWINPPKHSFLLQIQNVVVAEVKIRQKGMLTVRSAASLSFTITNLNLNVHKPLINQTEVGAQQRTTTTSTESGVIAVIFFISLD